MPDIDEKIQYYHGYKFRIYPTDSQKEFIRSNINAARYVYNWAIEQEENQYQLYLQGKVGKNEKFMELTQLHKLFVIYRHMPGNEWLLTVPLATCREAMKNAIQAYKNWFSKRSKHPKFKSKKTAKQVYQTRHDRMRIIGETLRIEGLPFRSRLDFDTVKIDKRITKFNLDNLKVYHTSISRDNLDNYYVSFCIIKDKPLSYFEDNNIPKMDRAIGIDLNFRKDARVVCSDGTRFIAPDISKEEKKIKRLSRKCGKDRRRQKELERANPDIVIEPSKRSIKRRLEYRKYNKRIHDKNVTFACTVAKRIVDKNPLAVVLEDLKGQEIMSVRWVAKYVQNNPLCIIKDRIKSKCNMYNVPVIIASKDYPSTQMCSNSGHIKKMYSSKTYICHNCGMRMDRDDNAALNLERLAYNYDFTHMSNINLANIG